MQKALILAFSFFALTLHDVEWQFEWKPAPNEIATPPATICPLKYGKTWAYSLEIDDGPSCTLTVAEPMLREFEYTDAPPGVSGGKPMPFVGNSAVMMIRVTDANSTFLSWDKLAELEHKGWRVANHSFWHSGIHWDESKKNTPEQFRRELYWSQSLLAACLLNGRGETHFVYPNGDYNYRPYLKEFGLLSASRVGGSCSNLRGDAKSLEDLSRGHLDEMVWSKNADPMMSFPASGPADGDIVIDLTHGMDSDPNSPNQKRWRERLGTIMSRYGQTGNDTVWCAPTSEITCYSLAARQAKLEVKKGSLKLTLPDAAPGSCLTVKLNGIAPSSRITPPAGGIIHRQGTTLWITTPFLGQRGSEPPKPLIKRIYKGPAKSITLPQSAAVAGVMLLQTGSPKEGFKLHVDLISPGGKTEAIVPKDKETLQAQWGAWLLLPVAPDRAPIFTKEIQITPDPSLGSMEIWAAQP